MKNYIQPGNVIQVTAPAAVDSGDVVQVGQILGVATNSASSGDDVNVAVTGVFTLPKVSGEEWSQGDLVYWQASSTGMTKAPVTGDTPAGVAVVASTGSEGTVRLHGMFQADVST